MNKLDLIMQQLKLLNTATSLGIVKESKRQKNNIFVLTNKSYLKAFVNRLKNEKIDDCDRRDALMFFDTVLQKNEFKSLQNLIKKLTKKEDFEDVER